MTKPTTLKVGQMLKSKLRFPVLGPDVEPGDYCVFLSKDKPKGNKTLHTYKFLHVRTQTIEYLNTMFFDVYFEVVQS